MNELQDHHGPVSGYRRGIKDASRPKAYQAVGCVLGVL